MQFSSSLIFSTSAAPNQQIIPAVSWCLKNLGPKVFIIGSKLEKSSAVDQAVIVQYIKEIVYAHSGQIAGEEYIKNTKTYIKQAIEKIIKTQPNSIINLLQGQDNFNFFAALRAHGISSEKIPSMSIYITELELDRLDFDQLIGDYATQNYFQSIDTPSNLEFIKNFKKIYGDKRHVNNHMENAYIGVLFWHIGVIQAQSFDTQKVRERVSTQALAAPEGVISIDKKTQHTWKPILVGRIFPNEQFGIVYNSVSTIQPLRNQQLKSNEQWHLLLRKWQDKFGSEP
jgi:urea transport system substrate-binding protein